MCRSMRAMYPPLRAAMPEGKKRECRSSPHGSCCCTSFWGGLTKSWGALFPEDCRHSVTGYDVTWPETFVDEDGRSSAKL